MDSRATDWVHYDGQDDDLSDDGSLSDDESSNDEPTGRGNEEESIYNNPAAFFATLAASNPNLPIPVLKSSKEVRAEARGRSKNITASYRTLRSIVERHEATIQKRWAKKTKQQKLKILLAAWPSMPGTHRPDFRAFRRETPAQREAGTKYRTSFMWPYINQEDLSKPRSLLLLINARGRYPPPNFATADFEAMHLGVVSKANTPIFLNQYVMMLNGVTEAKEYGKLLSWDDHDDAFDWMNSRKQFPPGEGLLVLEAQERLLGFLVQCCRQILHDIPEKALTSDTFPVQPEPQLKTESDENGFDSLAIMAANAPYRLPAKLDLDRIESLLAAKAAAAEDHVWALREDPGYFAECLVDLKEHRQETMKDLYNARHPLFTRGRESVFWARVIGSTITDAYIGLELFSELHRLSKELLLLSAKYSDSVSPGEDLPEEYLLALLGFRYALDQASKGPLGQLQHNVLSSPPMRRLFVRQPPPEGELDKVVIRSRPGVKPSAVEGELKWLLQILLEDDYDLFLFRLPLVVDELERLIQDEPGARELISSRAAGIIADLSIISQCSAQLELYLPWAANFEQAFVSRKDAIIEDNKARREPWAKILSALVTKNLAHTAPLGTPTDGRFTYPVKKRRNAENVATLRRAEENLDAFWASVDQLLHQKAGSLEGTVVRWLLSQPRVLQRTPEWVEPEKAEVSQRWPDTNADVLVKPFSSLFFGLSEGPGKQASAPDADLKVKVKTRGTPQAPDADAADVAATPTVGAPDPHPVFSVDARALKALRTLFFNPDVTSTPGEVSWADFLHVMVSTGFHAEKLYGSVWQFRPTKLDVERGIQFHEPHPRGKLPFTQARRYGRRLNRAYGWFGGMFALQDKSG